MSRETYRFDPGRDLSLQEINAALRQLLSRLTESDKKMIDRHMPALAEHLKKNEAE